MRRSRYGFTAAVDSGGAAPGAPSQRLQHVLQGDSRQALTALQMFETAQCTCYNILRVYRHFASHLAGAEPTVTAATQGAIRTLIQLEEGQQITPQLADRCRAVLMTV